MPQLRVKATDLSIVKAVTDNLEGSHNETEAKDLSIANVSFKIIDIREVHHNKTTQYGNNCNPIFREIKQIATEAMAMDLSILEECGHGRANYQNSNGAYQYQYYMHDPQPEQYGPPCSLCGRFNHSPKHC